MRRLIVLLVTSLMLGAASAHAGSHTITLTADQESIAQWRADSVNEQAGCVVDYVMHIATCPGGFTARTVDGLIQGLASQTAESDRAQRRAWATSLLSQWTTIPADHKSAACALLALTPCPQ